MRNSSGFGLVPVLVALAVASAFTIAVLSFIGSLNANISRVKFRRDADNAVEKVRLAFAAGTHCRDNLSAPPAILLPAQAGSRNLNRELRYATVGGNELSNEPVVENQSSGITGQTITLWNRGVIATLPDGRVRNLAELQFQFNGPDQLVTERTLPIEILTNGTNQILDCRYFDPNLEVPRCPATSTNLNGTTVNLPLSTLTQAVTINPWCKCTCRVEGWDCYCPAPPPAPAPPAPTYSDGGSGHSDASGDCAGGGI